MVVRDLTGRGTSYSDSKNREAPNKHAKGSKKYKEMIQKGNKAADQKNLPFTFIKPPKSTQPRRDIAAVCTECRNVCMVNKNTCGTTCTQCRVYFRVDEENRFETDEALEAYLESISGK